MCGVGVQMQHRVEPSVSTRKLNRIQTRPLGALELQKQQCLEQRGS